MNEVGSWLKSWQLDLPMFGVVAVEAWGAVEEALVNGVEAEADVVGGGAPAIFGNDGAGVLSVIGGGDGIGSAHGAGIDPVFRAIEAVAMGAAEPFLLLFLAKGGPGHDFRGTMQEDDVGGEFHKFACAFDVAKGGRFVALLAHP